MYWANAVDHDLAIMRTLLAESAAISKRAKALPKVPAKKFAPLVTKSLLHDLDFRFGEIGRLLAMESNHQKAGAILKVLTAIRDTIQQRPLPHFDYRTLDRRALLSLFGELASIMATQGKIQTSKSSIIYLPNFALLQSGDQRVVSRSIALKNLRSTLHNL